MSKKIRSAALLFASQALAISAFAGEGTPTEPPTVPADVTKSSRDDNKFYVGINWNFGVRTGATAVVGYRYAKTRSDDQVRGGRIELTYVLTGAPMGFGELRVTGLAGSRSAQGELGGGYGFHSQAFLLNAAVQGPYVIGGVDYLLGVGWQPYIGANTLGKPKEATETLSCPAGYTLSGSTCTLDD